MTEQFLENLCKQLGKSKSKTFGLVVPEQSLAKKPKIIPPDATQSDISISRGKDIEATSSAVNMNAKGAGQDLTVVKQIKHLGLQKVSSQSELGKSSKDQLVASAKKVERQTSALKNDQKISNQLRGGHESSSLGTTQRNQPNHRETEAKDDQMHGGAKNDLMHGGAKLVLGHSIGKPGNNGSAGMMIMIIIMFLIIIIIILVLQECKWWSQLRIIKMAKEPQGKFQQLNEKWEALV